MTDRAKTLSALYRAHAKATGAEKAQLRVELAKMLNKRTPETVDRIARAAKGEN